MRASRSFCPSVFCLLVGAIETPSANDTLSASRCNSSTNSGVNVSVSAEMKNITPTGWPETNSGDAAPDLAPSLKDEFLKRRAPFIAASDRWRSKPGGNETHSRTAHGLPDVPASKETLTRRMLSAVGPATATMSGKSLSGRASRDAGRVEAPAFGGGFAHQLNAIRHGIRPHDRFVGGAERREHARQTLLLLVGNSLFVGALEIVECERHVLGNPRQQRDDLVVFRPGSADKEQQHADASPPLVRGTATQAITPDSR